MLTNTHELCIKRIKQNQFISVAPWPLQATDRTFIEVILSRKPVMFECSPISLFCPMVFFYRSWNFACAQSIAILLLRGETERGFEQQT